MTELTEIRIFLDIGILTKAKIEAENRGVPSCIASNTSSFISYLLQEFLIRELPKGDFFYEKRFAFERLRTAANGDSARYAEIKQLKNQLKEYLRDVKYYSEQSASIIIDDLDVSWMVEHIEKGQQGLMLASIGKCYRECTKQEYENDCSTFAQMELDSNSVYFKGKRWDLKNGNILLKRGNVENANV